MKKEFKSIAMRCTQEQFDAVRGKLENYRTDYINNFNEYPYITNYLQHGNQVATCTEFFAKNNTERHELHETWNEKVFLQACGIVVEEPKEETFVITSKQLNGLCEEIKISPESAVDWIHDNFPSAFVEDKKELVVGKWYKSGNSIFNHQEKDGSYGILRSKWQQNNWTTKQEYFSEKIEEATPEEVKTALEKEALKRGVEDNTVLIERLDGIYNVEYIYENHYFYAEKANILYYKGIAIFHNGTWATIIKPKQMTQSDIEKELGYKIEIVK